MLMKKVGNMERNLLAELQRISREESGDLLERKAQKLGSRLERLNAKMEKLDLKFEALKMGNGTGGTAVL
jgi:chaperonin cofactor prefoldin